VTKCNWNHEEKGGSQGDPLRKLGGCQTKGNVEKAKNKSGNCESCLYGKGTGNPCGTRNQGGEKPRKKKSSSKVIKGKNYLSCQGGKHKSGQVQKVWKREKGKNLAQ